MRILLIAYEFPPSPSPQSLRWAYLVGRLAALGHEVHVMAPDIPGTTAGLPPLPPSVQVHRTWPGPVRAMLCRLAERKPASVVQDRQGDETVAGWQPPVLNWKGRLLERIQRAVAFVLFPDLRGEWLRPAMHALPGLLGRVRPDVVISSHEPATSLQLGLRAGGLGYRWVADLGDPVLAPYTPKRWRRRALELEREVLAQADHVLVTTAQTRQLLCNRHGALPDTLTVVAQGFDEQPLDGAQPLPREVDAALTELLYAGSFYRFRDPAALVDAAVATPGVRLNIASANVPAAVMALASAHPQRVRILGHVPHRSLLRLQRQVDVLVNIANRDPCQVPGKLYEYLGAGRPVLHIEADRADAGGELVRTLRRGWACAGDREALAEMLPRLRALDVTGGLDHGLDLVPAAVARFSWSAAAASVEAVLLRVVGDNARAQKGTVA